MVVTLASYPFSFLSVQALPSKRLMIALLTPSLCSYVPVLPPSSSFRSQVEDWMTLQHPNLVALLGCCCTMDDSASAPPRLLVYELAPNDSLATWLHSMPATAPSLQALTCVAKGEGQGEGEGGLREAESARRAVAGALSAASAAVSAGACVTEPLDWALRMHVALGCARG